MVIVSISLLFYSCVSSNKLTNEDYEERAIKITGILDSFSIKIFKTWNYLPRRNADIWLNINSDSSYYHIIFINLNDSVKLMPIRHENFIKDFKMKIDLDTSINRISIWAYNNGLLKIIGLMDEGKDTLIYNQIQQDSVFPNNNPIVQIKELSTLKDSLNIIAIKYYDDFDGFYQFYLSRYHVLTYITNLEKLKTNKDVWLTKLTNGKWIEKHWNFVKLDEPIELE